MVGMTGEYDVFSARLRRDAVDLLDLQLWLWGADIREVSGDLLLAYGMRRTRPPAEVNGSSCYSGATDEEVALSMWGFGVTVALPGAGRLFIPRSTWEPVFLPFAFDPMSAWSPEHVEPRWRPYSAVCWRVMRVLLDTLVDWITGYERWIRVAMGPAYRDAAVRRRFPDRVAAVDFEERWLALWRRIDRAISAVVTTAPDRSSWTGCHRAPAQRRTGEQYGEEEGRSAGDQAPQHGE
jgi:hypothetical protein